MLKHINIYVFIALFLGSSEVCCAAQQNTNTSETNLSSSDLKEIKATRRIESSLSKIEKYMDRIKKSFDYIIIEGLEPWTWGPKNDREEPNAMGSLMASLVAQYPEKIFLSVPGCDENNREKEPYEALRNMWNSWISLHRDGTLSPENTYLTQKKEGSLDTYQVLTAQYIQNMLDVYGDYEFSELIKNEDSAQYTYSSLNPSKNETKSFHKGDLDLKSLLGSAGSTQVKLAEGAWVDGKKFRVSTPYGWKLHISALPHSAKKVAECFERVKNRYEKIEYKILPNPATLRRFYNKRLSNGPEQIGKFLVIYPQHAIRAQEIAKSLDEEFTQAGLGPDDFVPVINDASLGHTGGIFVRYATNFGNGAMKENEITARKCPWPREIRTCKNLNPFSDLDLRWKKWDNTKGAYRIISWQDFFNNDETAKEFLPIEKMVPESFQPGHYPWETEEGKELLDKRHAGFTDPAAGIPPDEYYQF